MLKLIMNIFLHLFLLISNRSFASQVNNLLCVLLFSILPQPRIAKCTAEETQESIFTNGFARELGITKSP